MNDPEVIMHAELPNSNLVVYRRAIEAAGEAIAPPEELICDGICVYLRSLRFLLRCLRDTFVLFVPLWLRRWVGGGIRVQVWEGGELKGLWGGWGNPRKFAKIRVPMR